MSMSDVFELQDSSGGARGEDFRVSINPRKDWIDNFQVELDAYRQRVCKFTSMDATEVFQNLSAMCARASEIRSQLMRVDSQRCTSFRTRQVDPFLEECDRQFKIHSRITAIRDMEYRLSRGEF